MVKLSPKEIVDYAYRRFSRHGVPEFVKKSEDGRKLIFEVSTGRRTGKVIIIPEYVAGKRYDQIQFSVDATGVGINHRDFDYFLEHLVDNDMIFDPSSGIISYDRTEKELKKLRQTLERIIVGKPGEREVMACSIVNPEVSVKKLRQFVHNYMVRPLVYYVQRVGRFASSEEGKDST